MENLLKNKWLLYGGAGVLALGAVYLMRAPGAGADASNMTTDTTGLSGYMLPSSAVIAPLSAGSVSSADLSGGSGSTDVSSLLAFETMKAQNDLTLGLADTGSLSLASLYNFVAGLFNTPGSGNTLPDRVSGYVTDPYGGTSVFDIAKLFNNANNNVVLTGTGNGINNGSLPSGSNILLPIASAATSANPGLPSGGFDPYANISSYQPSTGGPASPTYATPGLAAAAAAGPKAPGQSNATALQDIKAALALGLPISAGSWSQAGYGPGGAALPSATVQTAPASGYQTGYTAPAAPVYQAPVYSPVPSYDPNAVVLDASYYDNGGAGGFLWSNR